jgi:hypothetical protein
MLSEEEWFRFANGGYHHAVEVCRLRPALVKFLGVETSSVRIDPVYAQKLTFKHRLTPHHFSLMKPTLEYGRILQESPQRLIFYRYFDHIESFLQVVIKPTLNKKEIWICTFHRQTANEIARKSKKCISLHI